MSDVSRIIYGNTVSAVPKIQTTAKAFGTFVSPTTGEILYIDPKHEDERHSMPKLTLAEAKEAHLRGFIDDYDAKNDGLDPDDDSTLPIDPNDIRLKAAERTEAFAGAVSETENSTATAGSAVDSRSSTAWPDRDRVEGGVQGSQAPGETAPSSSIEQIGARTGEGTETGSTGGATGEQSTIDTESGDDDAPPPPAAKPARKTAANKAS